MENQDKQQVEKYNSQTSTQQLIECLIKIEAGDADAKLDLLIISRNLMPEGQPDFMSVIKYPMIKHIQKERGNKVTLAILVTLVRGFCNSMNVVRNMNQDMMLDAAAMLLDECDNFRLEDYLMMFQLAKRGDLFDIRDRIDLQVISSIMDEYWTRRKNAGERAVVEQERHLTSLGNATRMEETVAMGEIKLMRLAEKASDMFAPLKNLLQEKVGNKEERARLRQIEKDETKKIVQLQKERGYEK